MLMYKGVIMKKLNKEAVLILSAKKCMTQKEVAQNAGISTMTMRKGFKEPISLTIIGKLARALGVEIEEIILE